MSNEFLKNQVEEGRKTKQREFERDDDAVDRRKLGF